MTEEVRKPRAGGTDAAARREAARLMGQASSERKKAAARANAQHPRNRPVKPLAEIPCSCEAGDSLEGHKSTCLRGRAIKRRREKGQPLT